MNARGLRGRCKAAHQLRDLMSFSVDVAVIQETYFVFEVNARVLFGDYVVCSVYGDKLVRGVFLQVKPTLNARVDLVHVDAVLGARL